MPDLTEMIGFAIFLFVGAYGAIFYTPLWWLGVIMGGFAVLLSLGVVDRIVSGTY